MKKSIKIIFNIIVTMLCSTIMYLSALGAGNTDVVVKLTLNDPIMSINGIETEVDTGRGTSPIALNGRTLVPVRAVTEAFDGNAIWDAQSDTVTLSVDDDVIQLKLNSNIAYFNGQEYVLDVAPVGINGRTMLPIRFIAESFNFGVAWDGDTQSVYIIKNALDSDEYNYLIKNVPDYSGKPYAEINNDLPFFKEYEIIDASFEFYGDMDDKGRCNVCFASVSKDTMPNEKRGSISSVTPTGWVNIRYETISGGYLYNRCHLIGYQLTGENANKRNLITGTRYFNIEAMLPFENMVDDYIESSGNHVMYRVTPLFKDNNLVAHGVLIEAYSVEDNGEGISTCVFCYNVQPSISIDYLTGASRQNIDMETNISQTKAVYRTPSGKKYHFDFECGGKNSYEVTLEEAKKAGLNPCLKCTE